jgi:hypothetical protein
MAVSATRTTAARMRVFMMSGMIRATEGTDATDFSQRNGVTEPLGYAVVNG